MWSKEKGEHEIYPDFVALNRLSSSRRLVTQTKLDWPQTWWSHSLLRTFNVLSWFEYWLSKTSDLRDIFSARFAAISEHSSFGNRIVWIVKQCPFELNFGERLEDSWIYVSTKIHAQWSTSLWNMNRKPKSTESVISLWLRSSFAFESCVCNWYQGMQHGQ